MGDDQRDVSVETVDELRLFPPITGLVPTPAMTEEVDRACVFQCSWCGCLVALTRTGKPVDCPQCDRRPTSWWQQDLSVGPFHQCSHPDPEMAYRIEVALELLAEYEAEYGEYYGSDAPLQDVKPKPEYL